MFNVYKYVSRYIGRNIHLKYHIICPRLMLLKIILAAKCSKVHLMKSMPNAF